MSIWQAYNSFIEENGQEEVLPELNMTSQELFFIGYAQVNWTAQLPTGFQDVLQTEWISFAFLLNK